MNEARIAELASWAQSRLAGLVDQAYAATIERIPLYGTRDLVSANELRESITQNLNFILNAVAHPGMDVDLTVPSATGRRRAQQGVPLPEVLRAYRITFSTLWDALVARARRAAHQQDTDALLAAASTIWQLTDEHAVALTESYRAMTAELLVGRQQRRSALVEALFTGHPSPDGGPAEAATLLDLPPDAMFVVVAADTKGFAEESLPGIERRLAERGVASAWRLTPALQLGVVALRTGQEAEAIHVLRGSATARTGVSPEYRSLVDTPRALQLARSALAMLPAGARDVQVFSASPLEALLARTPEEARRLVRLVLGPVLELPHDDRSVLLDTLITYVENEGSAESTAKLLHCHPNTIRYRLRRLHELTGRSLLDPQGVAQLATAAYALRLLPGETNSSGAQP